MAEFFLWGWETTLISLWHSNGFTWYLRKHQSFESTIRLISARVFRSQLYALNLMQINMVYILLKKKEKKKKKEDIYTSLW